MAAIQRRQLGITFSDEGAHLLLWAPYAKTVTLHNETTGTDSPLQKKDRGYWSLETELLKEGDLYRYSIDGAAPLPDPVSLSQPEGVHGPSRALRLEFPWTDQEWRNPVLGDYIIYELHTGTFTAEGTFKGIAAKLDYLISLGINAIELMPVAQFPGKRNWGYDGVYPFAVQDSYGGARELQQLVDTCHNKGLAVILDVVYNHFGPEGNYLTAYGPYLTDKYKTPWGGAVNFDDAYCDEVRRFFIENILMWFRDFHIDALRLDAVHAIKDHSPLHIIQEMSNRVEQFNQSVPSKKYLILETDLNDSRYIKSETQAGYGADAQWADEFHHSLRVAAGQERVGYYADFDGLADLAKAIKDAYVFTGQYSEHRHRSFGTTTADISGDHFIVFAQNHDQVGNRMLGERLSTLVSFSMQKLMAAVIFTAPFVPLLFMGEEWGAGTPFLYFTDHADKALVKAVEQGRKTEFAQFQHQGEPVPANEENTFRRSQLNWEEQHAAPHVFMLQYYQQLIAIRKMHAALKNYDRSSVAVISDAEKGVLILERSYKEQHLYCLFNFSKSSRQVSLKEEIFPLHVLLSSEDIRWLGKADTYLVYDHQSKLLLQPESAIILANYYVPA